MRKENKIRIATMLMRGKDHVVLETDSLEGICDYLQKRGLKEEFFVSEGTSFKAHFVKDNEDYFLKGNWFKGDILFFKRI